MISVQIKNMKDFMNKLLVADCFDSFLLEEATIKTNASYLIDGHINQAFYSSEEWADLSCHPYEFLPWKEAKSTCFQLIKGKKTPAGFRFILHLMAQYTASLLAKGDTAVTPEQVRSFVVTIKYDGSSATLTSGIAYHTFLLDKTPEQIWDQALLKFLDKKGITAEKL